MQLLDIILLNGHVHHGMFKNNNLMVFKKQKIYFVLLLLTLKIQLIGYLFSEDQCLEFLILQIKKKLMVIGLELIKHFLTNFVLVNLTPMSLQNYWLLHVSFLISLLEIIGLQPMELINKLENILGVQYQLGIYFSFYIIIIILLNYLFNYLLT